MFLPFFSFYLIFKQKSSENLYFLCLFTIFSLCPKPKIATKKHRCWSMNIQSEASSISQNIWWTNIRLWWASGWFFLFGGWVGGFEQNYLVFFFNYWVAGEKRLVLSCECDFYNSSDEQNLQTWATKMAISCLFKSILSTDKVILLQKLDSCKQTNTPPERLAYILKVQTPPNFRLTTQHNLFSLHCV